MEADDITRLLAAASDGSDSAMDEVFEVVYPRLKEIARARRRGWQGAHTMNTTGLIHEAYLKVASGQGSFENRGHFYATTARAMRHGSDQLRGEAGSEEAGWWSDGRHALRRRRGHR